MQTPIDVTVNGKQIQLDARSTVSDLLKKLKVNHVAVAIEIDGEIVPHQQITERQINDGETVEVVSLVGGG